ncbi:MAG: AmmeMemoRadiSam system radical SAM enzyme [Acidobacteria bacterium ACB2]|nr:AmmeMemoRadiSam system radical SAM enzyme [Acidobacteria bacterium ACB2]
MPTVTVQEALSALTVPGDLCVREGEKVRCVACGHRCLIGEGREGVCRVRFVADGVLRVPHGYVSSVAVDPIEKKPFFHVTPGAAALSFGMLGCDLKCPYCQNWEISQTLRDPGTDAYARPRRTTPEELVRLALEAGATMVTSTYNEPLVTTEWAVEVFRAARASGLMTSYVSNGNGTPEVIDYLRPFVDAVKVDLKGMRDEGYRLLGGRLAPVLDTIRGLVARGVWVEVVTLLVPGLNDGTDELADAARFLASVSRDVPWHVTAYHDDYRMERRGATPVRALLSAVEIGRAEGLRYVYAGNLPARVGDSEATRFPGGGRAAVERLGFRVLGNHLTADGRCPGCGLALPGLWSVPGRELTGPSVSA